MKRRFVVSLASSALALCAAGLFHADRPAQSADDDASCTTPEADRDRWMAVKLSSAQQIFEHLTRGDFEQLETSARRMQVLNFLEQWQREREFKQASDYQGQLNAFEFSTKELMRHAKDKNVDGALKAYLAMSESCVRCHELIRDVPSTVKE